MRSLDALIEQQVLKWTLTQKPKRVEAPHVPPVVTISRQFGSRGTRVGELVARQLGFVLWDQDLVHRMADEANVTESTLSWIDESPHSAWRDFVDGILMGDQYTESEYLRRLIQVVRGVADRGSAVVVGRGGQYILGPSRALRIRVVAPFEDRVAGIAGRGGLTLKDARRAVKAIDKERAVFMQHHYDRDVNDLDAYDLLVNVGTLSLEQAAKIVVAAYRARFED